MDEQQTQDEHTGTYELRAPRDVIPKWMRPIPLIISVIALLASIFAPMLR